MGGQVRYALTLFAIIAGLLIVVAYFAGAKQVGGTIFSGLNQLALSATGRNAQGQFAPYPGNAPSSGSGG